MKFFRSFDGRILPFNVDIAQFCSELMAGDRTSGRAIGNADGYNADTAAENNLVVETRDTSPFEAA
jgi:predicted nucleic acid-binding protein